VVNNGVNKRASPIGLPLLDRLSTGVGITINHLKGIGSISKPRISKESMVRQVLADIWEIYNRFYSEGRESLGVADTGVQKDVGRADRTCGEYYFL